MNTSEYNTSLEITKQFLENPVGYSSHEAVGTADKHLIRQNNVIICLLEQIMKKLNETTTSNDITDLVGKIDKLNIGSKKKQANVRMTGTNIFGYR